MIEMLKIEDIDSRRGIGRAPAHHGEILQGAFRVDNEIMRGLLSLPCLLFESHVDVILTTKTTAISVTPNWKLKAQTAARLTLDALDLGDVGAQIIVCSNTPISRGFGSSTGDVVAAIRAVVAAANAQMSDTTIAKLAVLSETASDGLMFDGPMLFAQRAGIVLERFGDVFPSILVLGFSTSDEEAGISTLDFPPALYSAADIAKFEELRLSLREGFVSHDVKTIGMVATASARINQRYLPVPGFDALDAAAADAGAIGLQVAHTGDIASFLFDANDSRLEACLGDARDRLARIGIVRTWQYVLSDDQ